MTIVILGRRPKSFLSEAKNLPPVSRQSHLPLRPRPFDFAQGDISRAQSDIRKYSRLDWVMTQDGVEARRDGELRSDPVGRRPEPSGLPA